MVFLKSDNIFLKLWYFLRKYILTIPRFDLFLQGTLLVVTLLDANCFLLLRRDATDGKLPPLIEDWVFFGTLGAEIIFGAGLSWFGRTRRNLTLSAWLAITAGSGLLVLAFPFDEATPPRVELCGGQVIGPMNRATSDEGEYNAVPRQILLIITAVLCSLTRVSIFSHGITYLDDHQPENGAYFYGILISIRLSLGLSGEKWLTPGARRDDWLEAHASLASLTLMFAILYTLFPRHMPDHTPVENHDGFLESLIRILSNKQVVIQIIAMSFLNAAVFGFVRYDAEFVQARYHVESWREDPQSSRAVGDLMRSLVIIFFIAIFRMRFSVRRRDGVKAGTAARVGGVTAVLVAVFFAVLAVIFCDIGDVAGVDGVYEQPSCSQDCGCNSEVYGFSPVCSLNTSTTYFSPCHAGCTQYEDLNGFPLFTRCACAAGRAVRGACSLPACRLAFTFYQFFFAVVLAVAGSSLLLQSMCVIRAVRVTDKPLAVGTSLSLVALAHVAAHALYMAVSNATCVYSNAGACLLNSANIWIMPAISAILALVSGATSILASRAPGDYTKM